MPTTYRVVLETETRPREAAVALDHLPAFQVDAPNVDSRRPARGVAPHRQPADPASRRDLVRAPRDHAAPHDPNVPHHDLDDEAEIYRLNVEYWPTTTSAH